MQMFGFGSGRAGRMTVWRNTVAAGCRIEGDQLAAVRDGADPGEWASGADQPLVAGVSGCPSPNPACTFRYAPGSPSMFTHSSDRGPPPPR
jgi:hypothetical protein